MRKLSEERRKLAAQAGVLAAVSGSWPLLARNQHGWVPWLMIGVVIALEIRLIVKLAKLRHTNGCM